MIILFLSCSFERVGQDTSIQDACYTQLRLEKKCKTSIWKAFIESGESKKQWCEQVELDNQTLKEWNCKNVQLQDCEGPWGTCDTAIDRPCVDTGEGCTDTATGER